MHDPVRHLVLLSGEHLVSCGAEVKGGTLRSGRETELGYRLVEAVAPIRSPVSINKLGRLVDQGCESPAFPQRCGQPVLRTVALQTEELAIPPGVLLGRIDDAEGSDVFDPGGQAAAILPSFSDSHF